MSAPPFDPLLRSLGAAVLLDGTGDVTYARECRGAVTEWGGVYGQLVRLTGPWTIDVTVDGAPRALADGRIASERVGERWRSVHRFGRLTVSQEIAPLAEAPAVVRRLRLAAADGDPMNVVLTSEFVPFLLPVLVEGVRPVEFRLATAETHLRVRERGFGLDLHWNLPPSYLFLNRGSWRGGHWEGPVTTVGSEHVVRLAAGAPTEVCWVLGGGLERDLDRNLSAAAAALAAGGESGDGADAADAAWRASTPTVRFPDAPDLEAAYAAARDGLRRLYVAPGDGLAGLVAGFPWYSAIWCRDLAWMLPAVLWLGDFEWAERSIASVFRFQAPAALPLLGGTAGELPMQIAPGPVFLYGTSDTTLYFPELVLRSLRHSGDRAAAATHRPEVRRIVDWARARRGPAGWVTNGGEAEAIATATRGVARVRLGIDAPDTTIWDSADRRDHAIDVQVLWIQALRSAAELEGDPTAAADLTAEAGHLAAALPSAFAWPDGPYLADSIRHGQTVLRARPNALRAVSAGLFERNRAREIVARALRDDLATPWGMRTLSAEDPAYRPHAYHEGQVWTIATGWAADAAYAAGVPAAGLSLLRTIATRFREENGGANECYRGDRPEPYNSCFLLGMSLAPFLTVLFERLWGLRVDATEPRLELEPAFPAGWTRASIDGLRLGGGRVAIRWDAPTLEVGWSGPGALTVVFPTEVRRAPAGGTARSEWRAPDPGES